MINSKLKNLNDAQTTVVIPAAGFGTRAQSSAKELLLHPIEKKPFIQVAIERAARCGIPHVITRADKTELMEWVQINFPKVTVQKISQSSEWADTVLQSESYWAEKNILLLPDTDFEPKNMMQEIQNELGTHSSVFAVFEEKELSKWGVIQLKENNWQICEKPSEWNKTAIAWGIIGFQRNAGKEIFQQILSSHKHKNWQSLSMKPKLLKLSHFIDFTR